MPSYPYPYLNGIDVQRTDIKSDPPFWIGPNNKQGSGDATYDIEKDLLLRGNLISFKVNPYDQIQEYTVHVIDIGTNTEVLTIRNYQNGVYTWKDFSINGGSPITIQNAVGYHDDSPLPFMGGETIHFLMPAYIQQTNFTQDSTSSNPMTGTFTQSGTAYMNPCVSTVSGRDYKWSATIVGDRYDVQVVEGQFTIPSNASLGSNAFTFLANNQFLATGQKMLVGDSEYILNDPYNFYRPAITSVNPGYTNYSSWQGKIVGYFGRGPEAQAPTAFYLNPLNKLIPGGCQAVVVRGDIDTNLSVSNLVTLLRDRNGTSTVAATYTIDNPDPVGNFRYQARDASGNTTSTVYVMNGTRLSVVINNGLESFENFQVFPMPGSFPNHWVVWLNANTTINYYIGYSLEIIRGAKMAGLSPSPTSTTWSAGDFYRIMDKQITSVEYAFTSVATPTFTIKSNTDGHTLVDGETSSNAYLDVRSDDYSSTISRYYWELWDLGDTAQIFNEPVLLERTENIYQRDIFYKYEGLLNYRQYRLVLLTESIHRIIVIKIINFNTLYNQDVSPFGVLLSYDCDRGAVKLDLSGARLIRGDPEEVTGGRYSEEIMNASITAASASGSNVSATYTGILDYINNFWSSRASTTDPITSTTQFVRPNCYLYLTPDRVNFYPVQSMSANAVTVATASTTAAVALVAQIANGGMKLVVREDSSNFLNVADMDVQVHWGGSEISNVHLSPRESLVVRFKSKNYPANVGRYNLDTQFYSNAPVFVPNLPSWSYQLADVQGAAGQGDYSIGYDDVYFYIRYPTETQFRRIPIYTDGAYRIWQTSGALAAGSSDTSTSRAALTTLMPTRNRLSVLDLNLENDTQTRYGFSNTNDDTTGGSFSWNEDMGAIWFNVFIFSNQVVIVKDFGDGGFTTVPTNLGALNGRTSFTMEGITLYPNNYVEILRGAQHFYSFYGPEMYNPTINVSPLPDSWRYFSQELQRKFDSNLIDLPAYKWQNGATLLATFRELADFPGMVSTDASPLGADDKYREGMLVYRTEYDRFDRDRLVSFKQIAKLTGEENQLYDYMVGNAANYSYSIFPQMISESDETVKYMLAPLETRRISPNWQFLSIFGTNLDIDYYNNNENLFLGKQFYNYLIDLGQIWHFKCNLSAPMSSTINTEKVTFEGLHQFPKINVGKRNYRSGSFSTMLGTVGDNTVYQYDFESGNERVLRTFGYHDSLEFISKMEEFCNNGKVKLLRDIMGNLIPCDITMSSFEGDVSTRPRRLTINIDWIQVADFRKFNLVEKMIDPSIREYSFSDDYPVRSNVNIGDMRATAFYNSANSPNPSARPFDYEIQNVFGQPASPPGP